MNEPEKYENAFDRARMNCAKKEIRVTLLAHLFDFIETTFTKDDIELAKALLKTIKEDFDIEEWRAEGI